MSNNRKDRSGGVKFFTSVGRITQAECDVVGDGKYATGKYLDLVKEVKPYK